METNDIDDTANAMKEKMILHCVLSLEKAKEQLPPNRKRVDRNLVQSIIAKAQKLSPSINRQEIYYRMRKRAKNGVTGGRPSTNPLNDAIALVTNIEINESSTPNSTTLHMPSVSTSTSPSGSRKQRATGGNVNRATKKKQGEQQEKEFKEFKGSMTAGELFIDYKSNQIGMTVVDRQSKNDLMAKEKN